MEINHSDALQFLVNKHVQVNRGGVEGKEGRLIAVRDDHLVLLTEEAEYVYCQTRHVKSVTYDSMETAPYSLNAGNPGSSCRNRENLQEVMKDMQYRQVLIYLGEHENIRGILCRLLDDHVILVCDYEVITVPASQIHHITVPGIKIERPTIAPEVKEVNDKPKSDFIPNQGHSPERFRRSHQPRKRRNRRIPFRQGRMLNKARAVSSYRPVKRGGGRERYIRATVWLSSIVSGNRTGKKIRAGAIKLRQCGGDKHL